MSEDRPLDLRNVIPRQRHTLIFDTYMGLKPGKAFVLINDHDPRPLCDTRRTLSFRWRDTRV